MITEWHGITMNDPATWVVAPDAKWREPLDWDKAAAEAGERRRVLCSPLADVFEDWRGPIEDSRGVQLWKRRDGSLTTSDHYRDTVALTLEDVRRRLWHLILETPHLDWLLLTKRPESMARWLDDEVYGPAEFGDWTMTGLGGGVIPNAWLGTTIEDQATAYERIPGLLTTCGVRLVVAKPVGPVDFSEWFWPYGRTGDLHIHDSLTDLPGEGIHGIICVGGDRPLHPDWVRSIRDQCIAAGVPYFFEQWGEYVGGLGFTRDDGIYVEAQNGETYHVVGNGFERTWHDWSPDNHESPASVRVGKKAAGRNLDGRTWDQFPEVAR